MPEDENKSQKGTPWCNLINPPCPFANLNWCGYSLLLKGRSKVAKESRTLQYEKLAKNDREKYIAVCEGARKATANDFTQVD